MLRVKVLFFASLKDRTGKRTIDLEIQDGSCVRDLKQLLSERFMGLSGILPSSLVSINRSYAFDEELISEGSEIAIFPPVSGGISDWTIS
jgi:molybdopterin converting factor subunit 1